MTELKAPKHLEISIVIAVNITKVKKLIFKKIFLSLLLANAFKNLAKKYAMSIGIIDLGLIANTINEKIGKNK